MPKYAILDNHIITQVMVANSEADLGVLGQLFETVNIDGLEPEPSRGWERHNGVWTPPALSDSAKALWNGAGFVDSEPVVEAEVVEEEPTTTKKAAK